MNKHIANLLKGLGIGLIGYVLAYLVGALPTAGIFSGGTVTIVVGLLRVLEGAFTGQ